MRKVRVIPVLLVHDRQLIKTIQFKKVVYVGDVINALRIFSDKEVDELAIIDRNASQNLSPDYKYIEQLVSECFMPLSYGGGIRNLEQAKKLFALGIEKIILGASAFYKPELIEKIANEYGAQSVVVSIDVHVDWLSRKRVFVTNGKKSTTYDPLEYAERMQQLGAGEVILHSIDNEGTGKGYELELIEKISRKLQIPVIALGGAGSLNDFAKAAAAGASAVGASSIFIFKGPHRAVLISYPDPSELKVLFD